MRTIFLALAALSIFQTSPPPSQGSKQQDSPDKKHEATTPSPSRSAVTFINADTKQRPEKPPWWDVAWSTWALVGIGIVAAYIGLRTLADIKKQTKNAKITAEAAQQTADAALLNAKAVISAERAWIMVELDWVPANPKRALGSSTNREPYTSAAIRFIYTNEGKTIAWIDEKLACFQIVKELPKQPNLSALQMLDAEPQWVGSKGGGHLDETLEAEGQEGMVDISVIWGVIRYRDAFGKHETVFGFRIRPDDRFERLTGLTEYNKTT